MEQKCIYIQYNYNSSSLQIWRCYTVLTHCRYHHHTSFTAILYILFAIAVFPIATIVSLVAATPITFWV